MSSTAPTLDTSPPHLPNMLRMPTLPRPALRTMLAAAFSLTAVVAFCALASAQGEEIVEVTIETPDNGRQRTDTGQVEGPYINMTYKVRQRNGSPRPVVVKDGVSILALLEDVGADLGYSEVEFNPERGGRITLTKDEIEHHRPPVIYQDDAGKLWFLGPSDKNDVVRAAHHIEITQALTLTQTPADLDVTLTADQTKIDPGESVVFTTKATGGSRDANYRFDWEFGDDDPVIDGGRKRTYEFPVQGTFEVRVTAKIRTTNSEADAVVEIQVGDEEKETDETTGTGGTGTGTTGSTGSTDSYGTGSTYTPSIPTPPLPAPPTPKPPKPPDIATGGPTIEGNLLADATSPPQGSALESAARAARERDKDDEADGAGVPEAALSFAGLLGLLGLGAGMELRQGRPLQLRLPRRAG